MARQKQSLEDEGSLPYRIVIDFLEGTTQKSDAVAFARGFIDHHFNAPNASGYFVMPYENGYVFEIHEGGHQRAYLPGVLAALEQDPAASICIQMARRILEVRRLTSGTYTAILLPEGMEPQSEDKIFPPAGPKLKPYQRNGMGYLLMGMLIFGAGLSALLATTIYYLIEVSGLTVPPLKPFDVGALPLSQWENIHNFGTDPTTYLKTLRYQDGKWLAEQAPRIQEIPTPLSQEAPSAVIPGPGDQQANPIAPTQPTDAQPKSSALPDLSTPQSNNAPPTPSTFKNMLGPTQ